jgi:hypothetical protein
MREPRESDQERKQNPQQPPRREQDPRREQNPSQKVLEIVEREPVRPPTLPAKEALSASKDDSVVFVPVKGEMLT